MSLMALAHTTPAAPPFNADFYIVTATVIPVLFVAIIVQGGGYQEMLRASLSTAPRPRGRPLSWQRLASLYPWYFLQFGAYLILTAGTVGEGAALTGLYERAPSGHPAYLFAATLLLLLAAAGLPAITLVRAYLATGGQGRTRRTRPERPPAAGTPRPPRISIRNPAQPMMPKWAKRAQRLETARNLRGR